MSSGPDVFVKTYQTMPFERPCLLFVHCPSLFLYLLTDLNHL